MMRDNLRVGVGRQVRARMRYVFSSDGVTLFGSGPEPRLARLVLKLAYWSPSRRVRRRLVRTAWAVTLPVDRLEEILAYRRPLPESLPATAHPQQVHIA